MTSIFLGLEASHVEESLNGMGECLFTIFPWSMVKCGAFFPILV